MAIMARRHSQLPILSRDEVYNEEIVEEGDNWDYIGSSDTLVPPSGQPTEGGENDSYACVVRLLRTELREFGPREFFGTRRPRSRYGLRRDLNGYPRYPPDHNGGEMGPNARVWRAYLDEAERTKRDMIEGWNDGTDVILVYAGLFSAVVTTFVVQASQKLDQDFGQITASLLTELIAIERAQAVGSPLDGVPASELTLSSAPRFQTADAWVNGLWFTSLTLSVVTASAAVLVRQWIQHYTSSVSGTPQEQAHIQHLRFMAIGRWRVLDIIQTLPVLLYAALLLFGIGIVVFLFAIKPEIARVVIAIGIISILVFVVTNFLPLFYPACPYRTPLTDDIRLVAYLVLFTCRRIAFLVAYRTMPWLLSFSSMKGSDFGSSVLKSVQDRLRKLHQRWSEQEIPPFGMSALKSIEHRALKKDAKGKIINNPRIISWLLASPSTPSVRQLALQAINALPPDFWTIEEKHVHAERSLIQGELEIEFLRLHELVVRAFCHDFATLINSPQFYSTERILRASVLVFAGSAKRAQAFNPKTQITKLAIIELATYLAISSQHLSIPSGALQPLYDLMANSKLVLPPIWLEWVGEQTQPRKESLTRLYPSYAGFYSQLRSFCQEILKAKAGKPSANMPPVLILQLICTFLLQHITKTYDNLLGLPYHSTIEPSDPDLSVTDGALTPLKGESLPALQISLRTMLLRGIVIECNKNPKHMAQLEDIVNDVCDWELDAIEKPENLHPTAKIHLSIPASLAEALDELIEHKSFVNSHWKKETYQTLFAVYLEIYSHNRWPTPVFPRALSSPEHLATLLSSSNCTHGFVVALSHTKPNRFHTVEHPSHLYTITRFMVQALLGQNNIGTHKLMIDSIFDAFNNHIQKSLSTPGLLWPCDMQPLVEWMLAYATDRGGDPQFMHERPFMNHFLSTLQGNAEFFVSAISPFLFDIKRGIPSFSQESHVLLSLTRYQQLSSAACSGWQNLFSWVHVQSHERNNWTQLDFERYSRMVEFLDGIANTLDIRLNIPHLVEFPQYEDYQHPATN